MTSPVRVLIADDHPMVRYGIAAVLAATDSVVVAGEAVDGRALLDLARAEPPDVVLTDLAMPGMGGVELIAALRAELPDVPVLVLTMHANDESVFAALRAGARGYLIKGADGAELVRAIESVAAGEAVYGAEVANRIIAFFTGAPESYAAQAFPELTERERDVLDLMAVGLRNRAIAERLGLSDKTVRNHVSSVLLKLQVPDRTAAALKAREAGLGQDVDPGASRPE
jgi:DNA-binding NarL/FixJ family response regulator